MSTPTNTNDNAKNVTDTEVVNKTNEKSLNTTSSVITPQFKGSSKAVANNTTHKINTGTSHNLANNKYYHSPYLKKEFKPTINSFELPPELKKLQPLIMSQHEAFSTLIKDLGNITLTLSKIIEKKKESYNLLKNDKKIPRSLRIKCELTTSSYYENDPDFLNLKDNSCKQFHPATNCYNTLSFQYQLYVATNYQETSSAEFWKACLYS